MRIVRLEVDGFGRFSGAAWDFEPGLTLFFGNNEAGKTTLLNGIRALLFGFEASRGDRTWYPAFEGGKRGSRVAIETARGEVWTIERHGDRGGAGALQVRAPNGNVGGQETLDRLLGGATRDVFNNIFAFGLGELQSFESLSGEGVRSRIYGAGAGLGGTSVIDVERGLRQQQDEAFKARGQKRINELLAEIETHHARIRELERQPAEYDELHQRLAELQGEIARLVDERRLLLERSSRLARIEQARPIFGELASAERQLAAGDPADDRIPADAVARWERRRDAAQAARRALAETDEAIERTRRRLETLGVDETLVAEAAEIRRLNDEYQVERRRAAERTDRQAVVARHSAEVEEHLRRLGPGWDEARLSAVDDSIAALQGIAEVERLRDNARSVVDSSRRRLEAVEAELAEREEELASQQAETLPGDELAARHAAVGELADVLQHLRIADERVRLLGERRDDLVAGAERSGRDAGSAGWLWPAAALIGIALAAGTLAGVALGAPWLGIVLGIALGGAAVAYRAFFVSRASRRTSEVADGSHGPHVERLALLDSDLDAARDARERLASEARRLTVRAELEPDADAAMVRSAAERLAEERARAGARRALETRVAALRVRRTERVVELAAAESDLAAAEASAAGWLVERGLDRALSPEAARQVLAAVGAARRAAGHRDAALAVLARDDDARRVVDRRLEDLLRRIGRVADGPAGAGPNGASGNGTSANRLAGGRGDGSERGALLDALVAELERSVRNRAARVELEAELAVLEGRRAGQLAEVEQREAELADWLANCEVRDEDELRARASRAAVRRELHRRVAEALDRLRVLLGDEAEIQQVGEALRASDPAAHEAETIACRDRLEEIESLVGDHQRAEGALRRNIRELESSDELGRLRQELAVLEATAAEEARRWTVRAITLRLLEETRARYERERQPQVIRDAERYFTLITGGRYTAIVAPPGHASVRVEEGARLRQKEPDELSRGTQEQLYLALRFGLIEQFARSAEALPVVMDDILVNFDEDRAARAAEAIRELARTHQVIYFTCHRRVSELLDPRGSRTAVLA